MHFVLLIRYLFAFLLLLLTFHRLIIHCLLLFHHETVPSLLRHLNFTTRINEGFRFPLPCLKKGSMNPGAFSFHCLHLHACGLISLSFFLRKGCFVFVSVYTIPPSPLPQDFRKSTDAADSRAALGSSGFSSESCFSPARGVCL